MRVFRGFSPTLVGKLEKLSFVQPRQLQAYKKLKGAVLKYGKTYSSRHFAHLTSWRIPIDIVIEGSVKFFVGFLPQGLEHLPSVTVDMR
jgi:hypothetical protein